MRGTATRGRRLFGVVALVLVGCSGASSSDGEWTAAGDGHVAAPPPPPAAGAPPLGASFANPLLASGPDPYVVRANGVYYYTHTSGDRIELWATTAMSRLNVASHVQIFTPPAAGANSRDLWAPELHRIDGR